MLMANDGIALTRFRARYRVIAPVGTNTRTALAYRVDRVKRAPMDILSSSAR